MPPGADQAYGGVPPVADSCAEYGVPSVPPGSELLVVIVSAFPTVRLNVLPERWITGQESAADTSNEYAPDSVGVPESRPVLESARPLGNVVPVANDHEIVPKPPLLVYWKL